MPTQASHPNILLSEAPSVLAGKGTALFVWPSVFEEKSVTSIYAKLNIFDSTYTSQA